jgi:plastocyanin
MSRQAAGFYMALMIVLCGCSSSHNEHPDATQSNEYELPVAESTDAADSAMMSSTRPNYHTVEITQMKFVPAELVVEKGDTVVWVNHDITMHDVTEQPSSAWTSGKIESGKSWSRIIESGGDYYCSIHVVMKGKLIVEEQTLK